MHSNPRGVSALLVFLLLALSRDECEILQDGLESPSLSKVSAIQGSCINPKIINGLDKNLQSFVQKGLHHYNLD